MTEPNDPRKFPFDAVKPGQAVAVHVPEAVKAMPAAVRPSVPIDAVLNILDAAGVDAETRAKVVALADAGKA